MFNDYFVNILEDANEITEMDYAWYSFHWTSKYQSNNAQ